jgi:hypothetical protein
MRLLILASILLLNACATVVNSATRDLASELGNAILNQNDLETVRQGAPAYLIMIDSFIQNSPRDVDLLVSGSQLYGSYAGAFAGNNNRAQLLSEKALNYARQAFCIARKDLCNIAEQRFPDFEKGLLKSRSEDLAVLNAWGTAWAGWIQVRSDDWSAIADIPKVKAIMRRIVKLDPDWDDGNALLYLGVMNSLLPETMGGKPELAKQYFERAINTSKGRNLMVKTLYARYYARMVFNQELHDRLLREVIDAPAAAPGLTLINTLAQEEARSLLAESTEYF